MSSSVVDWSQINPELIDLIMKRLDLVSFIRAGAVCRSWWSTISTFFPPKSHTPWLILSSPHQPELRYASDPADPKSLFKFDLPNIKHHFIVGSYHGFIISVDEIAQIHTTNPITGSHRLLPAITTLSCYEGAVRDPTTNQISSYLIREAHGHPPPPHTFTIHLVQKFFYRKVALFPTSSAGLISVIIHNCFQELAFARESDESWTFIQSPIMNFEDVLFHKGLLYAVNWKADLVALDILNFSASSQPVIHLEGWVSTSAKKYLVPSPCGSDLFLIARFPEFMTHLQDDDGDFPVQTIGFKIYKLNQSIYQWSEVRSFGADPVVVFLGFNRSVMLLAKDIPSTAANKGDCIYFTDDDDAISSRHKKQKIVDMGIFYMENNRIVRMDIAEEDLQRFSFPPPFWFTPLSE